MAAIITAMTAVFTAVSTWLMTFITSVIGVFYDDETGFTFLGVLALVSLAISIFFLIVRLIQNFLHLRG